MAADFQDLGDAIAQLAQLALLFPGETQAFRILALENLDQTVNAISGFLVFVFSLCAVSAAPFQ